MRHFVIFISFLSFLLTTLTPSLSLTVSEVKNLKFKLNIQSKNKF